MTQQLALFNDLPEFHGFKHEHGAQWMAGDYACRNYHGFFQSRERGSANWRFQVYAFSGPEDGDGFANVYKVGKDGDLYGEDCPINADGQVLILGRRWGRSYWDH